MLTKNARPYWRKNADAAKKDPGYLAFIRTLPCMVCSIEGKTQAHHIRHAERASIGRRRGDRWAVPLCFKCHTELHELNEEIFWDIAGLDPIPWCENSYSIFSGEI